MNVAPQEKSIPCLVRAAIAIGTNMRSLQGRQRPLLGDRAAPPIDIRDKHPECPCPRRGRMRCGSPKRARSSAMPGNLRPVQAIVDRFPQSQPFGVARVVGLERDDVRRPARRHGNPVAFIEEEGLGQDAATDLEVAPITWIGAAIAGDAGTHFLRRARTVGLAECLPGERARQRVGIGEDAAADNHVARRVQLEQKHLDLAGARGNSRPTAPRN